ncbi:hypothetical protein Pelo_18799 [Pelomyxa schiedti]|nr:hypothetical protein Pelo_18799 [Pelomyxa schiedti]
MAFSVKKRIPACSWKEIFRHQQKDLAEPQYCKIEVIQADSQWTRISVMSKLAPEHPFKLPIVHFKTPIMHPNNTTIWPQMML